MLRTIREHCLRQCYNYAVLISCIVPAWNEEKTVGHVLDTLLLVPEVSEIIVINDGSDDSTGQKINMYSRRCAVLHNEKNLGKSATIAKGVNAAKGDVIMMIDADLAGLTTSHVQSLIDNYKANPGCMVIASATDYGGVVDKALAPFSGQRIFPKKRISDGPDSVKEFSYAIEIFLNGLFEKDETKYIAFEDAGHVYKYEKATPVYWIPRYIKSYLHYLAGFIIVIALRIHGSRRVRFSKEL